jgi:two-component system CheB/CheR fusion protein
MDARTVIGIGASAGGLTALKTLFTHIPADSGLVFVVVVHLPPDHESHLANILQPHVKMPVQQVTQTLLMQGNCVYLIPPNANLEAIDSHLRLSKLEPRRQGRAPVDHFFRTLAQTHDGRAVGVILSGTGSDGALGIKAIKEGGGLTVVQAPDDAEYDGMPQSAIATGVVDLILPLAEIPDALLRVTRTMPRVAGADRPEELGQQTRRLLQQVFGQVKARTSRDFTRYKHSTMLRRITRRMQINQVEELGDYLDLLRSSPEEVCELADDLLITVTNFFRDAGVVEKLQEDVVPRIFARRNAEDNEIRVWSVGCATGEEAYSLAILLLEEAARHAAPPRLQVFASDLHEHSLERARLGFFPGDIEADVTPERLRRFFTKEDGGYRIRKEVREIVVFAPHNLLSDPPFSRMDLISCRNLLIYLEREVQDEVVELFHYASRPEGFLVVGTSEAITRSDLFLTKDKKTCVFVRRDVPTPEPRLSLFPTWKGRAPGRSPVSDAGDRRVSYGQLHQRIVERVSLPSMLVGPEDTVLHLSEHAGRYLVHPGGELTASVLKLVRPELAVDLRAALADARRGRRTQTSPIRVQFNGDAHPVVLHVRPSLDPQEEGFALVIFDERAGEPTVADAASPTAGDSAVRERELEAELGLVKQRLQAIIEEYETGQQEMKAANEELQSANEELRSTMEELETSKEELHSMNEELQTVNQENRHKVEELAQLSGDLQNLLAATEIATLFLDRELRIMRFTPKVGDLFNVRAADRGRPLSDLTHRLGYENLRSDAEAVLAHLTPLEREVRDQEGRWYLTRLHAYRSAGDRIDGVVITFVDITERKGSEEKLRQSEERASDELRTMAMLHDLVGRLLVCPDLNTALQEVLEATIAITGADMGNVQLLDESASILRIATQRGFSDEFDQHFATVRIGNGSPCSRALEERRRVVIEDVLTDPQCAPHRKIALTAGYRGVQSTPLVSRSGDVLGVLSTHYRQPYRPSDRDLRILDLYTRQATDFIERAKSANSLREKTIQLEEEDERKGFFLATLGHELRNPLATLDGAMRLIEEGVRNAAELQPVMSTQIEHLKQLVNDLLEISHITRGTLSLRKSPVDLARVVRGAAKSVEDSVREKEQKLILPAPTDSLSILGDETRLEQVIANLLGNASKYTQREGTVEVVLGRAGGDAVITVRDDGRGLARAEFHRIFEPFAQTDPGVGGLGIGLALVKRLVELHGGSVAAHSEGLGRGSVFTVRLPIGEVDDAADAGDGRHLLPPFPPSTRVLVVDDARDHTDTLTLLLQVHGAETVGVYTGGEGIEQARSFRPQVALIDIGLPDMPGYEVARRIREQLGDGILLLAVTGFGDPIAERKALQAGFDERIVKPVDHERLHALIARHVENG